MAASKEEPMKPINDKDMKRKKPCVNCKKKGRPQKPPMRVK